VIDREHLLEGIAAFNQGRCHGAHEILEVPWRQAHGHSRLLLQGLIQTAAACYHLQHRRPRPAAVLLRRARSKLADLPENAHGVNVAQLRRDLQRLLAELEQVGAAGIDWRLRIRVVE
jgi:predicted metal-dependent hydrolase